MNNETSVWKLDEYISFQYWVDPIMLSGSSRSKIWSWPSNFMKTILGNVDETSILYLEVSSMTK
jgi:hypothetical protein